MRYTSDFAPHGSARRHRWRVSASLAALLACAGAIFLVNAAHAETASSAAEDDLFSDGSAFDRETPAGNMPASNMPGGGFVTDRSVIDVGWWHHQRQDADPCDGQTAGDYCLPGNPLSPVIIQNAPCPPGTYPPACPPGSYPPACPPGAYPPGANAPLYGAPPGVAAGPYVALPAPPDPFFPYAKNSLLQQVEITTAYIPRLGGGGIGFIDVDDSSTYAIPVSAVGDKTFLVVTPGGETHFVDGPDQDVLPHHLYDADVLVQFLGQTPDNFLFDVGADPGWHSDNKNHSSDDWRTAVYAAIGYRFSPTFAAGVGIGYLDRRDIGLIPIGGVIWVPNPDTRFELYPPKPRIEYRICAGNGYDDWFYVGGQLGGGQWAIERPDGTHDVASYRDWRALMGVERRSTCGGLGGLAEVGYVFSRRLEFGSNTPTYDPPNTLMVRLGVIY